MRCAGFCPHGLPCSTPRSPPPTCAATASAMPAGGWPRPATGSSWSRCMGVLRRRGAAGARAAGAHQRRAGRAGPGVQRDQGPGRVRHCAGAARPPVPYKPALSPCVSGRQLLFLRRCFAMQAPVSVQPCTPLLEALEKNGSDTQAGVNFTAFIRAFIGTGPCIAALQWGPQGASIHQVLLRLAAEAWQLHIKQKR